MLPVSTNGGGKFRVQLRAPAGDEVIVLLPDQTALVLIHVHDLLLLRVALGTQLVALAAELLLVVAQQILIVGVHLLDSSRVIVAILLTSYDCR